MRFRPILGVLAALGCGAAAPPNDANERAYTLTLMCAVVASHYEVQDDVLRTMDALRKMQRVQGYDDARISADMVQMASVLGAEFRADPDSMRRNREICRSLRLMA